MKIARGGEWPEVDLAPQGMALLKLLPTIQYCLTVGTLVLATVAVHQRRTSTCELQALQKKRVHYSLPLQFIY